MLIDVSNLSEEVDFNSDICIIGGGAVGIDIARFFNTKKYSVILVESGGFDFEKETQELYEIENIGRNIRGNATYSSVENLSFNSHLDEQFQNETRIRQFGGTTNIWSGKWKMLDPIDFERREWVPNSGWPISYHELVPYYQEIAQNYNLLDRQQFLKQSCLSELSERDFENIKHLNYPIYHQEKTPTNFNISFRDELHKSRNVTVLIKANAFCLNLSQNCNSIQELVVKTLTNKKFCVHAKIYILACGGLENARLLLVSNNQISQGIGNINDLVGRFYMDHPKGKFGIIKFFKTNQNFIQKSQNEEFYRTGFSLSSQEQTFYQTLNHNFFMQPIFDINFQAVLSLNKKFRKIRKSRNYQEILPILKDLVFNLNSLVNFYTENKKNDLNTHISHYEITHYLEQSPNYNSRVFLSENKDILGMRKLILNWQLSALDTNSFIKFFKRIQEIFNIFELGEIISNKFPENLDFCVDASHHMGTTRMGFTPKDGVVDANCQVFGVGNLFIAGSSVFPTGGNANPTYTILALARRMSHYLDSLVLSKW